MAAKQAEYHSAAGCQPAPPKQIRRGACARSSRRVSTMVRRSVYCGFQPNVVRSLSEAATRAADRLRGAGRSCTEPSAR